VSNIRAPKVNIDEVAEEYHPVTPFDFDRTEGGRQNRRRKIASMDMACKTQPFTFQENQITG